MSARIQPATSRAIAAFVPGLLMALLLAGGSRAESPLQGGEADKLSLAVRNDRPIEIEAEELEALRLEDGRQRVVFTGDVRVTQEDLKIGCDWLEALYSKEGGEPERFTCRGTVTIRKAEVEARCQEATFDRARHEALCTGQPAELRRGDNLVQGPTIRFDTQNDKITVKGGARIRVRPESRDAADPEEAAE